MTINLKMGWKFFVGATVALVVLKIFDILAIDWLVVFIPIFIPIIISAVGIIFVIILFVLMFILYWFLGFK